MMKEPEVLIYQQSKNVVQSGSFKNKLWHIRFINYEELDSKYLFDLMNWSGGKDTIATINIPFSSKEEAIRFAESKNLQYTIQTTEERQFKPKSYASNFK